MAIGRQGAGTGHLGGLGKAPAAPSGGTTGQPIGLLLALTKAS